MSVDFFVGGRPGRYRVPPMVLPRLFDRARRFPLADGAGVLVPAPEDMLLLLAEKVQRKGNYTRRSLNDTTTVLGVDPGALDWGYVVEQARQTGIEPAIDWLLANPEHPARPDAVEELRSSLEVTALERRLTAAVAGDLHAGSRSWRRARSIQRNLWLLRWARRQRLSPRQAWAHVRS
jgi:hypothetical protein